MPFDQHMLLALIAPRLLYIGSSSEDSWADPKSEYRSAVEASPVYELYGCSGVKDVGRPLPDCDHPLRMDGLLSREICRSLSHPLRLGTVHRL